MSQRGERQKDVTNAYREGHDRIWRPKSYLELEAEWERDPDNIGDGTMGSRSPMPRGYKGRAR